MIFDEENEQETQIQEQTVEQVVQPVVQPESPKLASDSFKELRTKAERIERERDEALRRIRDLESKSSYQPPTEEEDIRIGNDDIAEGKHLNAQNKKIKKLEEQVRMNTIENRIRAACPDFESVVTKDNIEMLKSIKPGLARLLETSHDIETTAKEAYSYINEFVINKPKVDYYEQDKERARINAAKPRPLASVSPQQGDSPLSNANAFANGLTPELQKQLLKEMSDSRKSM